MVLKKVTESQVKASRKWEASNKEKAAFDAARRQAKRFINKFAQDDDLKELEELISKKREELKN